MPSSSARCAQFPRAQDKVHFYIKLRELRDHLKGVRQSTEIEEVAYSFDLQLAKGKLSNLYETAEWNLFSKSQARRLHCDILKITTFPTSCAVKFWIKCLISGWNRVSFTSTEDAKRTAIKEEQYDPGYEDAYGGAYAERGAEGGQAQSQTNGHCTFSSAEHRGNVLHSVPLFGWCSRMLHVLTYSYCSGKYSCSAVIGRAGMFTLTEILVSGFQIVARYTFNQVSTAGVWKACALPHTLAHTVKGSSIMYHCCS